MATENFLKKCGSCGRTFQTEQDVLQYGSSWRICKRGALWFNCTCDSTLMVPKGMCDWYSPAKVLKGEARTVFNSLPELKTLPNISSSVMELLQLIQQENVTSKQLATAAKREPVIAANILKMANNFKTTDRTQKIESLDHAISYVGLKALSEMITAASIQAFPCECKIFEMELFWREALMAGRIAEHLAREFCRHITPDDAYIAGCLYNVGKIVMSLLYPAVTDKIAHDELDPGVLRPWVNGEAKYAVPSHRVLGEIGASIWGMPDFVCNAAAGHHRMPVKGNLETVNMSELTALANQLAHWLSLDPHKIDMQLLLKVAAKFGFVTESQLDAYVEKIGCLRENS